MKLHLMPLPCAQYACTQDKDAAKQSYVMTASDMSILISTRPSLLLKHCCQLRAVHLHHGYRKCLRAEEEEEEKTASSTCIFFFAYTSWPKAIPRAHHINAHDACKHAKIPFLRHMIVLAMQGHTKQSTKEPTNLDRASQAEDERGKTVPGSSRCRRTQSDVEARASLLRCGVIVRVQ